MKRILVLVLTVSLLLSGCGWMRGSYVSVTPHQQPVSPNEDQPVTASNYLELRTALETMVASGIENRVISVGDFGEEQLKNSLAMAVRHVKTVYPIGAYAVEDIICEVGTNGGAPAVAVTISYIHPRGEIQKIKPVENMDQAREKITAALTNYDTSLVMLIDQYEAVDIQQLVQDFARDNPGVVMETPEVAEQTYPNSGQERILELKFTYQSSRDSLRSMQEVVRRIFASAVLYISRDVDQSQQLAQLYAFLMERFPEYQIKTSLTPSYSLLNHGVGDSRAFAAVYAEMCERIGLECHVVVGTRNGVPWTWNIVCADGYYYHVDLLDCLDRGGYQGRTDRQMASYVWDYSAYPVCEGAPVLPPANQEEKPEDEPENPETEPSEETQPDTQPTEPPVAETEPMAEEENN